MPDQALTMRQLCDRFGVTRWTIHQWIRDREFPKGDGFGGRGGKRWNPSSVERWEAHQDAKSEFLSVGDDPR